MALSEIDGGSVPAWTIKCEVETRQLEGSDGITDEIRFYHMKLVIGDSTQLYQLTYVNKGDIRDAEEGTPYRVQYTAEVDDVDMALKMFESFIFQKFFDLFNKSLYGFS